MQPTHLASSVQGDGCSYFVLRFNTSADMDPVHGIDVEDGYGTQALLDRRTTPIQWAARLLCLYLRSKQLDTISVMVRYCKEGPIRGVEEICGAWVTAITKVRMQPGVVVDGSAMEGHLLEFAATQFGEGFEDVTVIVEAIEPLRLDRLEHSWSVCMQSGVAARCTCLYCTAV